MIQPHKLKLTLRRVPFDEISNDNLNIWLDDIFTLLRCAETAPSPQAATVIIPIELESGADRKSVTIMITAIACSLIAMLCFCLLALTPVVLILRSMLAP